MQLIRTLLLLASVSEVALASADAESRPHKKRDGSRKQKTSSRRSLRHEKSGRMDDDDDREWAIQQGMLHLQAAEVETEALQDIIKVEREDEKEEHPEMAAAEDRKRKRVELQAASDWSAVARAASAESVHLRQRAAADIEAAAAPAAAAPAGAPAAPADFSWAHKMDAAKPLQEQGFEGKMVQHVDFDTMTEDWHKEHVQSWSTLRELCAVCERHPDNAWCRGKCPGTLESLGGSADAAAADAADTAKEGAKGGKSLEEKMGLPGNIPSADLPGSDGQWPGKEGGDASGPPGGIGDIFKSGASERSFSAALCIAAMYQAML